jgi:hypothetical protein
MQERQNKITSPTMLIKLLNSIKQNVFKTEKILILKNRKLQFQTCNFSRSKPLAFRLNKGQN